MAAPTISLILPVRIAGRRREGALDRLLLAGTSIAQQTLPKERYEVVVVDDASEVDLDYSLDPLSTGGVNVTVHRTNDRIGLPAAYNEGIATAAGDIIFLGLDDYLLAPDCLEAHVDRHDTSAGSVFLCGIERLYFYSVFFKSVITGELTDSNTDRDELTERWGEAIGVGDFYLAARFLGMTEWTITPNDVVERFDELARRAALIPPFEDMYRHLENRDGPLHWLCVRFGNHSVPKSVLLDIGGIRGFTTTGANADQDLGLRLRERRIPIEVVREALTIALWHKRDVDKLRDKGLKGFKEAWPYPEVERIGEYFTMPVTEISLERYAELLKQT